MTSLRGDVRDAEQLRSVIEEQRPEVIFHLAAQSLVRHSYQEPTATFATNVMGTVHLLDAVRGADSVRVCQVITSDKCYANREWLYAYRENDPLGGHDPYSASKGAAELVVASFRDAFFPPERLDAHGVSISSARAGNVIGGGDWAEDRLVPDIMRALQCGADIRVRNPDSIRPFQYVLEPLAGYLWLAARQLREPGKHAQAWNFGPAGAGNLRVGDLVDSVVAHWGDPSAKVVHAAAEGPDDPAPHEATLLSLDCTKANRLLSWFPVLSLDEGVECTVAWYRGSSDGNAHCDPYALSREQIAQFVETARERGALWAGGS
jgi:CDP-glucose 4,6-dehydratase